MNYAIDKINTLSVGIIEVTQCECGAYTLEDDSGNQIYFSDDIADSIFDYLISRGYSLKPTGMRWVNCNHCTNSWGFLCPCGCGAKYGECEDDIKRDEDTRAESAKECTEYATEC